MNIRLAHPEDVPEILFLVNEHARRGDLLPRTAASIHDTLADWLIAKDDTEQIVACVSLYSYSPALAEVRSLAVHDRAKGGGWGSTILKAIILEARRRDIQTLFALTRAVRFFQRAGFEITGRERFPEKVWRDCRHCALINRCDETAVVLNLGHPLHPQERSAEAGSRRMVSASERRPMPPTMRNHPFRGVKTMSKPAVEKVVLAYSGGLDTSVIVPWLRENYGCEVICFCANIGQGDHEFEGLEEKGLASGASKVIIEDLRHEFAKDFLFPMMQAGAIYERQYLLGTSVARPLIAKWQVAVAEAEGADAVAHGCTGKGNDQVRFELTYKALNPTLKVIAPWREWDIRSREDALAYARAHHVPVTQTEKSIYSRDANMWHLSHEGGILEDPANEPEESMFQLSVSPENAPDEAEIVEITFDKGVPVAVNGIQLPPAAVVETVNKLGSKHGIGRIDLVENRLVGMKSRGVYETPGGTILYAAHRELESLCLDRETLHFKQQMALRYAEMTYFGMWYHTLRESLQAFIDETQKTVSGWVKLKLYKGNVIVAGRYSPHSLYREDFATFGQEDVYDQADAEGFITLFGLQMKVKAMMEVSDGGRTHYASPDYSKFKRD
ncbi:MAG: argininosuccinate synthase [Anaerolineae bacterium]|nr:argininosuccinate synthase [Promineifilum sp.]MCO5180269.1 argininosuccinate synthase [Promineifilum sp.]MCW5846109.1 argininosuccinate synthase [Anaerolineae bacterium]